MPCALLVDGHPPCKYPKSRCLKTMSIGWLRHDATLATVLVLSSWASCARWIGSASRYGRCRQQNTAVESIAAHSSSSSRALERAAYLSSSSFSQAAVVQAASKRGIDGACISSREAVFHAPKQKTHARRRYLVSTVSSWRTIW